MFDFGPEPIKNDSDPDSLYERIEDLVTSFNIMGSAVAINKCYFDGKFYTDDSICLGTIHGCMANYPYNTVQYSKKNEWMFYAAQLLYCKCSNIIPHTYHNLPRVFKIRRRNGDLYDAVTLNPMYSIRIRKSSTLNDIENQLYVRVHFSEIHQELSEKMIEGFEKDIIHSGYLYKDVLLQDIYKENDGLGPFQINFKKLEKHSEMPDVAEKVYVKVNDEIQNWYIEQLEPCLERYKNDYGIDYLFKFE